MATLRERGRTFRNRAAPLSAGVSVAVSRVDPDTGTTTATIVTAVVGRTVFADNTVGGTRVTFGERDYLIPAADYLLGPSGAVCEPKEGDQFTETVNGVALTFEMMPIPGEPAWRYSDSGRTLLRIHVKRVTDEFGGS